MNFNFKKRRESLSSLLKKNNIDSLLIRKRENILYLTGVPAQESFLLFSGRDSTLITDPRYYGDYKRSLGAGKIAVAEGGESLYSHLGTLIRRSGLKRVGVESNSITLKEFALIKKYVKGVKFYQKNWLVESLREVKEEIEIRCIDKACGSVCRVMDYAIGITRPGRKELEIKNMVISYMLTRELSEPAFDIIIASGRRSAVPHQKASGKKTVTRGEPVIIDMGTRVCGYSSDLTRPVFLGRIDRKYLYIYNIVRTAQRKAIDALMPGKKASDIDRVAREYISGKGAGKYFIHSVGHGVGLEVHERPYLSRNSNALLKEGMVVTIEPGIYIPSWGGVRIEDTVLITKNGAEILTKKGEPQRDEDRGKPGKKGPGGRV